MSENTKTAQMMALEDELRDANAKASELSNWLRELRQERGQVLQDMALGDPTKAVQRIAEIDRWLASAAEVQGRVTAHQHDAQARLSHRAQWESGPAAAKQRAKGLL